MFHATGSIEMESALRKHATKGDIASAEQVLHKLAAANKTLSDQAFTIYLDAQEKHGDLINAEKTLERLDEAKTAPSLAIYSSLLAKYVLKGNIIQAGNFVDKMVASNKTLDISMFTVLLKGYIQNKDLVGAENVFDKMLAAKVTPTLMTYNTLMHGCLENGDDDKADETLQKMKAANLTPNSMTFFPVINAYVQKGDMAGAERVLKRMLAAKVKPGKNVLTALFYGYLEGGQLDEANDTLDKMTKAQMNPPDKLFESLLNAYTEHGISPKAQLFNALISIHVQRGDMVAAEQVRDRMISADVQPNTDTLGKLLIGYTQQGDHDRVNRLRKEFDSHKLDLHTATSLIRQQAKRGEMLQAEHTIKKILKANLKPNASTFAALLQGYVQTQTLASAKQVLVRMHQARVMPTRVMYTQLFDAFLAAGEVEEAEQLLRKILRAGFARVSQFNSVIAGYAKDRRDMAAASRTFDCINKSGLRPDVSSFNTLIYGCALNHDSRGQMRWLKRMIESGITPTQSTWNNFDTRTQHRLKKML